MKYTKIFLFLLIGWYFLFGSTQAAIRYGSDNLQAPFAATTTQKVNDAINNLIQGQLGASSTTDVSGIVRGAENVFVRINNWLKDKAGIDLFGILKAIGHLFLSTVGFFFDLIKRQL